MSNFSLKEQLEQVASQFPGSTTVKKNTKKPQVESLHTNNTNKKVKPKWLDYVHYGIELLKVYFPKTFKSANEIQPLKKGIKQDLVKRLSTLNMIVTEDKACMVRSLAYYVNTLAYHRSVMAGANRVNLDGEAEGVVSAEEAQYSIERRQSKLRQKSQNNSSPSKG